MNQQSKAKTFRDLHTGPILVLPNAWDAASARLIEAAGAPAVATTSAGVSWSLGVPDGGHLGRASALSALARVSGTVHVPVTADVESGYGLDPDGLAELARDVIATGAAGINIEDSVAGHLLDVAEHHARITAVRQAAGPDLFVNARVDTYLLSRGGLSETLRRAEAYVAAGADGVFVPGVVDADTISALVDGIDVPLNIMAGPGAPTVGQLADLGVARVSVGAALTQAAYALAHRAARVLLTTGTYEALVTGAEAGDLNTLLRA